MSRVSVLHCACAIGLASCSSSGTSAPTPVTEASAPSEMALRLLAEARHGLAVAADHATAIESLAAGAAGPGKLDASVIPEAKWRSDELMAQYTDLTAVRAALSSHGCSKQVLRGSRKNETVLVLHSTVAKSIQGSANAIASVTSPAMSLGKGGNASAHRCSA